MRGDATELVDQSNGRGVEFQETDLLDLQVDPSTPAYEGKRLNKRQRQTITTFLVTNQILKYEHSYPFLFCGFIDSAREQEDFMAQNMNFEAWEHALKTTCGYFQALPQPGKRLVAGHFTKSTLLGVECANFSCDITSIDRSRSDVKRDDWEHLYLLVQMSGRSFLELGESREILTTGNLYLLDSNQPSRIIFSGENAHVLSMHLPRNLMMAERSKPLLIGKAVSGDAPDARKLLSYLSKAMCPAPSASSIDTDHFFRLTGDLFSNEAEPVLSRSALHSQQSRFRFVIGEIELNLTDPNLSIEWLARRASISKRQMERDFCAHNTTVIQVIRQKRLSLVREHLKIGKRIGKNMKIIDAALSSGFRDISNFNRSFRSAYNLTPREFYRTLLL